MFPNFQIARVEKKIIFGKDNKDKKQSSLHSIEKKALIFVVGHYLFLRAHSFPRRRTVRFSKQLMSVDKFTIIGIAPNGSYCLYIKKQRTNAVTTTNKSTETFISLQIYK